VAEVVVDKPARPFGTAVNRLRRAMEWQEALRPSVLWAWRWSYRKRGCKSRRASMLKRDGRLFTSRHSMAGLDTTPALFNIEAPGISYIKFFW